jgi:hypothetical protein
MNVASIFGLVVLAVFAGPSLLGPIIVLAGMLALFTCAELFYLLFHLILGRHIPALRHSSGAVILLLACSPWLTVIFIIFQWLSHSTP